jgi:hypothetical protein
VVRVYAVMKLESLNISSGAKCRGIDFLELAFESSKKGCRIPVE